MEVRQLRYFVAVAEAGSVSRAAERCGVAQPSLSQQIIKLESRLGVELFDRLGRGVALTDAGRALLPRARRILAQLHEVEANLRAEVESGRGRLAVGAIPTIAPYILPGLVARLRGEYPDCEILVREDLTQNLVEALVDSELDVAIMSTPVEHELIELDVLGREAMLVVAPIGHPICAGEDVALGDLRDQPAVTLHEMHCLGRQITDFCASRRLARSVVCRMTQIDTLLEFVRLGLGVSIVPEMVAARDRDPGRQYMPFRQSPPVREIALARRAGRARSLLNRRFAQLLAETLATEPR